MPEPDPNCIGFLTLAEEEYAEDVDRVLVWRAIKTNEAKRRQRASGACP